MCEMTPMEAEAMLEFMAGNILRVVGEETPSWCAVQFALSAIRENAALREEVKALKANRWAGFTKDELQRLTEHYNVFTLHREMNDELARREALRALADVVKQGVQP